MPRVLKRLLYFLVLPLVLVAGGAAVFGWLAWRQFTPEKVVHQLESVLNARVQLDGCALSLFSSPARLELNGLHFYPRDADADAATAPGTRPPVKISNTYARMRRGVLEADLVALVLRRELRVRSLLLEMGDVKSDLLPSGEWSLRELFGKPATISGKPNPAMSLLAASAAAVVAAAEVTRPSPPPDTDPPVEATLPDDEPASPPVPGFQARDLGGSIAVEKIRVVDGRLRLRNRKSRAVTELNGLNLEITGLAVDPARLAEANHAAVTFQSQLWVDGGRKSPGRLAEMKVQVEGTVTPFDAATGMLQPDSQFTMDLSKGATLRSLPALAKIEKTLARARRAGLKISSFAQQVTLADDTRLHFHLHSNALALTQAAVLDFTDHALALEAGSTIDLAAETHEVKAAWIASQAVSDQALSGAQKFLDGLGEDLAKELRALLIDPLVQDGRLHMDFASKGDLSKPEVRVAHPLQDVTDQLKDAGRGLLDGIRNK